MQQDQQYSRELGARDMRSYHTEVWREAGWRAPERPCNPKPQLGQSHPSSISISKNGGPHKTGVKFKQQHTLESVLEMSVQTERDIPTHLSQCLGEQLPVGANMPQVESIPSTACTSKARWDMDTFLERRCFVILLLFLKQKKENSFSLFLFFQIKINYNPSLLMNAGWSWP